MGDVEKRFKAGACVATVFVNDPGHGREARRSVSLQRVYKDADGVFRFASSLWARDVPKAILVLCRAYAHLVLQEPSQHDDSARAQ